ncbi:MAG: PAS domain S-box protein [Chloroflexi bacterium]|nr:PAS domain S-box protein [Chloroflexota bacterium]
MNKDINLSTRLQNLWQSVTATQSVDVEDARQEYLTKVVFVLMSITILAFFIPSVIIWSLSDFDRFIITIVLMTDIPVIVGWFLTLRGYWRLTRYIPIGVCLFLGSFGFYSASFSAPFLLFFALAIVLTSMLWDIRAQWFIVGLSILTPLAIEINRTSMLPFDNLAYTLTISGAFIGIALLQSFSTNQINIALEKIQKEVIGRQLAEGALKEKEALYQAVIERSPIGISVRSPTGKLLSYNQAWQGIWAIPEKAIQDDLTRERQKLVFDEKDSYLSSLQEEIKQIYQKGGFLHAPEIKTAGSRDGSAAWVSQYFYAIKDEKGEVDHVVILTEDITARKRTDLALEKSHDEITALFEASTAISSNLSLEVVLQTVIEQIPKLLNVGGCSLSIWDPERNLVESLLDYYPGHPETQDPAGTTYDLNEFPATKQVLETRQPLTIQISDPLADKNELDLMKKEKIQTLLMLPLIARDQVVGLVELYESDEIRDFSPEEILLVQNLTNQAAIAIENARLYELAQLELIERKLAEQALLDSERSLKKAQRLAQLGSWEWNLKNNAFRFSDEGLKIHGISEGDKFNNMDAVLEGLIHPDDREMVESAASDAAGGAPPRALTYRIIRPDNSIRWISGNPPEAKEVDSGGKPTVMIGTLQDITERQLAAEAIKESEERYRLLAENASDVVWLLDLKLNLLYVSPSIERLRGFTAEETMTQKLTDVHTADSLALLLEEYSGAIAHEKSGKADPNWSRTIELEYICKDGSTVWTESIFNFVHNPDGSPYAFLGITRDIRERKQAEKKLKESEENYRNIFELAPDGIVSLDLKGMITSFNPAFIKITGYSEEAIVGKHFSKLPLVRVKDIPKYIKMFTSISKGNIPEPFEVNWLHKDGTSHYGETSIRLLKKDGKIIGILTVSRDTTDKVRANEKLKEYSESLEEMVADRTQELQTTQEKLSRNERLAILGKMAGTVSHELRNPLAAISNAIYYLKTVRPKDEKKVTEYLEIISGSVDQSSRIITDMLSLTGARQGDRANVKVSDLVEVSLERFPPPENVKVEIKLPAKLPSIFVDSHQIDLVLNNLISNAYQAMPKGGKLTIQARSNKKEKQVRVSITDTGEGILKKNMDKLFEPLFTTKRRGKGLGLVVSRDMVEANEGSIEVKSSEGKGATFTVILPTN